MVMCVVAVVPPHVTVIGQRPVGARLETCHDQLTSPVALDVAGGSDGAPGYPIAIAQGVPAAVSACSVAVWAWYTESGVFRSRTGGGVGAGVGAAVGARVGRGVGRGVGVGSGVAGAVVGDGLSATATAAGAVGGAGRAARAPAGAGGAADRTASTVPASSRPPATAAAAPRSGQPRSGRRPGAPGLGGAVGGRA
jgi:hypothetical protein